MDSLESRVPQFDSVESRVSQFVTYTGANSVVARQLLAEHNWNVDSAVKLYNFMRSSAAVPPPGPQKNIEPKNVNATVAMNPNSGGGVPTSMARPLSASGKLNNASVGVVQVVNLPAKQTAPGSPSCTVDARKLKRGLSKTSENLFLVNKARDDVLHDITESEEDRGHHHFLETAEYTFVLPDLTIYSEDFHAFLHKDLIETSTLVSLEQAGRLNWWADMGACQRLLPLATTGDGNCLLHAASLGMWGFHDRMLTLRKALFRTLTNCKYGDAIWRRWRWHQMQANKQFGLVYSEQEWRNEWENLLKLASTKPRIAPGSEVDTSCCNSAATKGLMERVGERDSQDDAEYFYESLEEFHVFVLAHVLRRPIIVVADTVLKDSNGEALAPIPFGGIYLPFECEPRICHRAPLLLTYDASHFSAICAMEQESSPDDRPELPVAIPLVDPEFRLLPIHYMVDPGPMFDWSQNGGDKTRTAHLELSKEEQLGLIRKYLSLECLPITNSVYTSDIDANSDSRSRSSSNGGDSDEINAVVAKDKGKVAKQMQSVAKSFGSIGKTMSKKIKKNFAGAGKGQKGVDAKDANNRRRRSSVGSATQSTKVNSITVEMLGDRDHILCVKLSKKRPEYQNEMVQNYLASAQERFKQDRVLRRLQDEEMKARGGIIRNSAPPNIVTNISKPALPVASNCVNPGCDQEGSAATSYLCPACFQKEKQQALDYERRPASTGPGTTAVTVSDHRYATTVADHRLPPMARADTLITSGKSKFYTTSAEDHISNAKTHSDTNLMLNNKLDHGTMVHNNKIMPTKEESYGAAPPAASYIINDLCDVTDGYERKCGTLPTRLPSQRVEQRVEVPPLQQPIQKELGSPTRKPAFKIRDVPDDVGARLQRQVVLGSRVQQRCRTDGCQFYGTQATDFLCSACYKQKQQTLSYKAKQAQHS